MSEKLHDVRSEYLLLESLKNGDEKAIAYLFDKYSTSLFAVIKGSTGDNELCEEILQNTFVHCIQNIENYATSNQPLFTWLFCISQKIASQTIEAKRIKEAMKSKLMEKSYVK